MIKYREQPYEEYFKEMEQTCYGDKPIELSYYTVANLQIYMKWVVELYWNKFGKKGIVLFEPGCWMGESGVALEKLYQGEVTFRGMEISKRVIEESKRYHDRSYYGDIGHCPEVASGSFDVVFSRTLLGFLKDIPAAIGEMLRLTATPGLMIVVQPMPYIIGFWHYSSMDSFSDLDGVLAGYKHEVLPAIPVYYGPDRKSVFGETILIVEKV